MRTLKELIKHKGTRVHTIDACASIHEAAISMNDARVGALVVIKDDEVHGILSERDILRRVVADARDPSETMVREVMTDDLITATPHTSLDEARKIMRTKRIRHLPILDGTRLVGVISIGDLNLAENESLSETIHYMELYIAGASA